MSKITVSGFSTAAGSQWSGSTAYLRIYYYGSNPAAFSFSTGEVWSPSVDNFYREISCALASNIVTVSTFVLDSTPDITNRSDVFCRMVLLDSSRSEDSQILLADRWDIPISLGMTVTFEALRVHNETPVTRFDDRASLSRTAIEALVIANNTVGNPATTSAIGRVKASATPTDAASPTAIVEGDGRAGKSSANYASLSAAVSAIGSTPTDLYVTNAFASGASTTVPATLRLVFVSGGSLVLGSGHTVVLNGPIVADGGQIFSGSGVVRFTSNVTQTEVRLSWWGVTTSTSVDQSTAVNAAFAALRAGMTLIVDVAGDVRVESTLTVFDLRHVTVKSGVDASQVDLAERLPKFVWYGSVGSTVLKINHCRECVFQGFGVYANRSGGTAGQAAAVSIHLDQDGTGSNISSANTLRHVTVHSGDATNATWIGVKVDNANGMNNEHHVLHITAKSGYGYSHAPTAEEGEGVFFGHSNVKGVTILNSSFIGLARGVHAASNSGFRGYNNKHSLTAVLYYGSFGDAIEIVGDDCEGAHQILVEPPGTGGFPISIVGGRYADIRTNQGASLSSGVPVIQPYTGTRLTIRGCKFEPEAGSLGAYFLYNPAGTSTLEWTSNVVSGITTPNLAAGFATFSRVHDSGRLANGTFDTYLSTGTVAAVIGVASNQIQIGQGEAKVLGLFPASGLSASVVGTAGSTQHILRVYAKDASGNRTPSSGEVNVTTANATLSGTDLIRLTWTPAPNVTGYDVVERDVATGLLRLVATVGAVSTYDITSNPAGALTYVAPTYNETASLQVFGPVFTPVITFADGATTPSVANSNEFSTANTGATSITNFTQGQNGQTIRVLVDANTTLVNGASIKLQGAANFVGTSNDTITLTRRGGVWYETGRSVN